MNGRERVLAMLEGQPTDRLPLMPITMMFAADQRGASYGKYATDYRVLAECQLHVAEKFDFDYVSCISDPAREAADCGAKVQPFDDQPPAIDETNALLVDKRALAGLRIPDPLGGGRMHDRVRAASMLKDRVGRDKVVEGWIEGPCAEAADLRGINRLMTDFFDDPEFVRDLFDFVLELGLRFAKAQIEAGVDLVGIGDAAASLVGPRIYEEYVQPYERKLVQGVQGMGAKVRMHICGNIGRSLVGLGDLGAELVDLDSPVSIAKARAEMRSGQVIAGNIDPVNVLRQGSPESIMAAIAECHRAAGAHYVVAAGCEVPRDTAEANVRALHTYASSHRP